MKKSTRIWIIVGVIILLIVGIVIYTNQSAKNNIITTQPPIQSQPQQPTQKNWIDLLGSFIKKVFTKKPISNYVQIPPIDVDGCDALGYNAIGVKCNIGY